MNAPITVVIADDHRLIRDSLNQVLSMEECIRIVGEASNGPETIDVISQLEPNVALLDHYMPGMEGVDIISPIIEKSPTTKILMLCLAIDEYIIFKALKAGAKGYISKDAGIPDLVKAVQAVHRGEMWVQRKLLSRFFEQEYAAKKDEEDMAKKPEGSLTPREQEVLLCLVKGSTNKEIAQALFISEKTVKSHLNSIFRKLNVSRRLEAILFAIKRGLA